MKVDTQTFLRLVEGAGTLVSVDIEATGLKGDYNSILCASFKPWGRSAYTISVEKPGADRQLVKEIKAELEKYDCWVTYYGRGFDMPDINTRLLYHRMLPVEKRPHIDMYWQLKAKTLMSRRSQGHLLNWLRLPEQKMSLSAEAWNEVLSAPKKAMREMVKRNVSDVVGLECLYDRTKHLLTDITT